MTSYSSALFVLCSLAVILRSSAQSVDPPQVTVPFELVISGNCSLYNADDFGAAYGTDYNFSSYHSVGIDFPPRIATVGVVCPTPLSYVVNGVTMFNAYTVDIYVGNVMVSDDVFTGPSAPSHLQAVMTTPGSALSSYLSSIGATALSTTVPALSAVFVATVTGNVAPFNGAQIATAFASDYNLDVAVNPVLATASGDANSYELTITVSNLNVTAPLLRYFILGNMLSWFRNFFPSATGALLEGTWGGLTTQISGGLVPLFTTPAEPTVPATLAPATAAPATPAPPTAAPATPAPATAAPATLAPKPTSAPTESLTFTATATGTCSKFNTTQFIAAFDVDYSLTSANPVSVVVTCPNTANNTYSFSITVGNLATTNPLTFANASTIMLVNFRNFGVTKTGALLEAWGGLPSNVHAEVSIANAPVSEPGSTATTGSSQKKVTSSASMVTLSVMLLVSAALLVL